MTTPSLPSRPPWRGGRPWRRRADALDAALDAALDSGRDAARRDARLVAVAGLLREVPDAPPRPAFVEELRARLVAEAAATPAPASTRPAPAGTSTAAARRRRERGVAAALGTAAVLGASGFLGVASQAALPGELLYPVKSALESVQEQVATGDRDEGMLLLGHAGSRLDELEELVTRDDDASRRATAPTLRAFGDRAHEAGDLLLADYDGSGRRSSVVELRDFAATSMGRLEVLAPLLPATASDELDAAADVLVDLDDRAVAACPDCGTGDVLVVPRFLAAGSAGLDDLGDLDGLDWLPAGAVVAGGADGSPDGPVTGPRGPGVTEDQPATGEQGEPGAPTATGSPSASPTGRPTAVPTGTPSQSPGQPSGSPASTPTRSGGAEPTEKPSPTAPRPTGESRTPSPPSPTSSLVEGLTETLLGTPSPGTGSTVDTGATPGTGGGESPNGLVDGTGELLGEVTGSLLGTPAGEAVEHTVEGARGLVGGALRGLSRKPTRAP